MTVAMETARREASGWKVYVLGAYYLVTGNVSLSLAGFGVLEIVAGIALDGYLGPGYEGNMAIIAGYLGIWGVTFVIIGLGAYGALWANKAYGRAVHGTE